MFKRIAAFIIAALTVVTLFSSCGGKDDENELPEGFLMATNDAVDYYFYYPAGWTLDKNDGMISAYASEQDPATLSVTTFNAPSDFENLDKYFNETYEELFKANFGDAAYTEKGTEILLEKYPAYRCQFVSDIAGGKYKFMQVMSVKGGYIYLITYTSSEENYDKYYDDMVKAVEYFKFK